MTRLRWEREEPRPRHPYRDTVIFNAVLAGIIVLVTALTHGNLLPGEVEGRTRVLKFIGEIGAVLVATIYFVVATAFGWWRLRRKEQGKGKAR